MSGTLARIFILVLILSGSLGMATLGVVQPVGAEAVRDTRDGKPHEWERQVAADARGDVLIHWPGSVDLYYMTIGELYAMGPRETYILIRIGYDITLPGEQDIAPPGQVPLPPPLPSVPVNNPTPNEVLTNINITIKINEYQEMRIALYSLDFGETWLSDQGNLVTDAGDVGDHKEVIYIAPFRRFGLEAGDILSDYNVSAYRNWQLTDTMQGFEPLSDYAPDYYRVHPLLDRLTGDEPLPLPPGVPQPPGVPEPPVPLPPTPVSPDPKQIIPDDPWPTVPSPGDQGIPEGLPTVRDLQEWDPIPNDRDDGDPAPVDLERLQDDGGDMSSGAAWSVPHRLTDGTGRFVARAHQDIYTASFNHVGWANFTLESRFEETDQRVILLLAGIGDQQWLWRYGLDMPLGIKDLPAGGTTEMSFIGVPNSLFASATVFITAIFISDWGGLELVPIDFFNTNFPDDRFLPPPPTGLPSRLVVDLLNEDDPFRVNEVRKLMIRVRDDTGVYEPRFQQVRAFIYPAGTAQPAQPYQLTQKAWMDGVYEVDFVFNRPGSWIIDVYFYDYAPTARGQYPSIDFQIRVDHPATVPPIIPFPAALGSLGLLMLAVVARERMTKTR